MSPTSDVVFQKCCGNFPTNFQLAGKQFSSEKNFRVAGQYAPKLCYQDRGIPQAKNRCRGYRRIVFRIIYSSSGSTGRTSESTAAESSRSLIYKSVPFERGTLMVASGKPAGTEIA